MVGGVKVAHSTISSELVELVRSGLRDIESCLPQVATVDNYSGIGFARLSELSRSAYGDTVCMAEPLRTVHHFACTGGTLIAKCLAAMPNTRLLSEVEPHSGMIPASGRKFYPTDLIALVRAGSQGSSVELETKIFLAGLGEIYKDCCRHGQRLVLRDHAHSKYCLGQEVRDSPGLFEIVSSSFKLKSIITVRHPFDSYVSLIKNRWLHFRPKTPEEYSSRYLQFLADHKELKVFRYEDFVRSSAETLVDMCSELKLPFNENFEDLFSAVSLSGDSGRSSGEIAERKRRTVPDSVKELFGESASYHELCNLMGYESELN